MRIFGVVMALVMGAAFVATKTYAAPMASAERVTKAVSRVSAFEVNLVTFSGKTFTLKGTSQFQMDTCEKYALLALTNSRLAFSWGPAPAKIDMINGGNGTPADVVLLSTSSCWISELAYGAAPA